MLRTFTRSLHSKSSIRRASKLPLGSTHNTQPRRQLRRPLPRRSRLQRALSLTHARNTPRQWRFGDARTMDAAYSLRSTCNDSFASTDSFTVVAHGDAWDDDEWEQLCVASDSAKDDDGAAVARVLGTSQLYERYAAVEQDVQEREEPDDEPRPFITVVLVKALAAVHAPEPHEMETRSRCLDPQAAKVHTAAASRPPPMSPASKSLKAKEALKAFYLSRAKQTEEKRKLLAAHATPAAIQPAAPRPRAVILPLKAPVRYSVAVREQVLRLENAQRARMALQQFYVAREVEKQKRAARNR